MTLIDLKLGKWWEIECKTSLSTKLFQLAQLNVHGVDIIESKAYLDENSRSGGTCKFKLKM